MKACRRGLSMGAQAGLLGRVMSDWGGTRAQQYHKWWRPGPGKGNCCGMFFYSLVTAPVGSQDDSQRQRGLPVFIHSTPSS